MRIRRHARDRRIERRLARKVTKTGEKCAPEVYQAYLAGMQRGMEIQEEQQAAQECMSYRDIFGNEIPSMKMRDVKADDALCVRSATGPSVSLH
ncbi:hypothetical protein [Tianweitania sp.]|uniref:hypothetical protein n=1 Tax=Tianweitania sp. TaxID=2021634 RepID=UPI00289A7DC0|nr:hypothetical protein [Tianweitania sp.]